MRVLVGQFLDHEPYDPSLSGKATLGDLAIGPGGFLDWVSKYFGVIAPTDLFARVLAYQTALAAVTTGFHSASFAVDPWGVARRLLKLRDDLLLAAPVDFDLATMKPTSDRLVTLVAVEQAFQRGSVQRGQAELIRSILERMKMGLRAPIEVIHLAEDEASWPELWQQLWRAFSEAGTSVTLPGQEPVKDQQSDLGTVQKKLLTPDGRSTPHGAYLADGTLIHIRASYVSEAADAVAALVGTLEKDGIVVIRAAEPRSLDLAFSRAGLPSLGHQETSSGHSVRSILPLVLDLAIAPINPSSLLDFLKIEPSPLPESLRRAVSKTLDDKPGWSSAAATATVDAYVGQLPAGNEGNPVAAATKNAWLAWLMLGQEGDGTKAETLTLAGLRDLLTLIEEFTTKAQKRPGLEDEGRSGLSELARDVSDLKLFVNGHGRTTYSRVELQGMLARVLSPGLLHSHREASRVHAVDHPASLLGPVDTVIYWMGGQSSCPRSALSAFTPAERDDLEQNGLRFLPEGLIQQQHADAVRAAVLHAKRRFVLVTAERVGNESEEPLSIWYQIEQAFVAGSGPRPLTVKSVASDLLPTLGAKTFLTEPRAFRNFQQIWNGTPSALTFRESESPSSIEKLVGCPLQWVLHYKAGMRGQPRHAFEIGPMQSGNVVHAVYEQFFRGAGIDQSEADQRKELAHLFESIVAESAGLLIVKGNEHERLQAKAKTIDGAVALGRAIRENGYEVDGCEVEIVDDTAVGRIGGFVDLVLRRRDNPSDKVIIDYKWGSKASREQQVRDGFATQLAIYSRLLGKGLSWPKTAYFIVFSAQLVTRHRDLFQGVYALSGPDEKFVWGQVELELQRTKNGFASGIIPVGIRAERAGELKDTGRSFPAPCKYCEFTMYCQNTERSAA